MEGTNILKIITAIGNEKLNSLLKKDEMFNILEKDIFYKEGILEFLEQNNDVEILIFYERLAGEIKTIDLIKKIKNKDNNIEIFVILEEKNEKLEKEIKKEKIINIFYNDEINIDEFIKKLKNTKKNKKVEKEIIELKNIIYKQNEELKKYQEKNENKKIIKIIGLPKAGKTLLINNFKQILEEKNNYEFKEFRIDENFQKNKENNIENKIIIVIELTMESVLKSKNFLEHMNQNNKKEINIIFNKNNIYSLNIKIAKNLLKNFKILGTIKLNKYCDFLYNKKNNYFFEIYKLKKEYLKIIKKIEKEQ